MPTIAFQLSDDAMPRVREVARARGFDSPEAYLQELLADDLRRRDQQRLESTLLDRLDSGLAVPMDDADFRAIRERAAAAVAGRRRA